MFFQVYIYFSGKFLTKLLTVLAPASLKKSSESDPSIERRQDYLTSPEDTRSSCVDLPLHSNFSPSRKIPVDKPLWMNDGQIQSAELAGDTAARREEIFKHETEGNFVFGKFLLPDVADAVLFFALF